MTFSKNFALEDLTSTNLPFANIPNIIELDRLHILAENILQPIHDLYGKPFRILSGFRSTAVNNCIGGSPESQHRKGEAVDIQCENNYELFMFIKKHLIFDQLIWKGGNECNPAYIHVSYKKTGNRNQTLKMIVINGVKYYESI